MRLIIEDFDSLSTENQQDIQDLIGGYTNNFMVVGSASDELKEIRKRINKDVKKVNGILKSSDSKSYT
jgi:hypothetical protein